MNETLGPAQSAGLRYRFGPIEVDADAAEIRANGRPLAVQRRVFDLILYLVRHNHRVVPDDELLRELWRDVHVSRSSLYHVVAKARRSLSAATGEVVSPITCVRGRGYRFVGEVTTVSGSLDLPLEGRSVELAALGRAWVRAAGGERRISLLSGEAGIGKTTLLEAFLATLPSHVCVGRADCHPGLARLQPYGPLLVALGEIVSRDRDAPLARRLRRAAPGWLDFEASASASGGMPPPLLPIHAILRALDDDDTKVVLVLALDDLHWSDLSTLDALRSLLFRRVPGRLLILATLRTGEPASMENEARQLLAEVERRGSGEEIVLGRFRPPEVASYLRRHFGTEPADELTTWLTRRTSGNPLFLASLVETLKSEDLLIRGRTGRLELPAGLDARALPVPDGIRTLLKQQRALLTNRENELLEVIAVVGRECSSLAIVAGLGGDPRHADAMIAVEAQLARLAARLPWLERAGIERWPDGSEGLRLRLTHELYAELLYDEIVPSLRACIHRRLAEALERAFAQAPTLMAPSLAHHFRRGGEPQRAITSYVSAIDECSRRCGRAEALAIAEDALASLPEIPPIHRDSAEFAIRSALAPVLARAPSHPLALQNVERALVCCLDPSARAAHASLLWILGHLAAERADHGRAFASARELERLSATDPELAPLAHEALARVHFDRFEWSLGLEHAEFAWREADRRGANALSARIGNDVKTCAGLTAAWALRETGRPRSGVQRMEATLVQARASLHPFALCQALTYAAAYFHWSGLAKRARAHAGEAMALADELGLEAHRASAEVVWLAASEAGAERLARLQRALASLSVREASDDEVPLIVVRLSAAGVVGEILRQEGHRGAALVVVEEALRLQETHQQLHHEDNLRMLRASLLEDRREAERELEKALAAAQRMNRAFTGLRASWMLARQRAERGDRQSAAALLRAALEPFPPHEDLPLQTTARRLFAEVG